MEKIVIVTGGSKGIGNGIIEAYQKLDYRLFSISRTKNTQHAEGVEHIQLDLSESKNAETILPSIFQLLDGKNIEAITLINNAATLGIVDTVENIGEADIQKTIALNLTAPFLLTASFIRLTQQWTCTKKIINISSGAVKNPYYGWAVYASTKAAIDMMTKIVALEQEHAKHGVKIISIHPGVIDTEMQAQIRKTDESKFKDVKRFIDLKNENKLATPADIGAKIYGVAMDDTIATGSIVNLREVNY